MKNSILSPEFPTIQKAFSGTFTINGQQVQVTTQVQIISSPFGRANEVNASRSTYRSHAPRGGDHVNLSATADNDEAAHEIGHNLGAGDQYTDDLTQPILDASGNHVVDPRTGQKQYASKTNPGFSGTIMADNQGKAHDKSMEQILKWTPDKTTCAQNVTPAVGTCE